MAPQLPTLIKEPINPRHPTHQTTLNISLFLGCFSEIGCMGYGVTLLRKRNQTLFHFSYLGKIKRAQLALSSWIRGKIVVFVVSRTLVSLPPSAGPPLDLGLAMAAPRVSLLLIAHSMRCFAPPSATMMPFICSVVLQDPPLGDGLFAPTVTPEVGGSSTKAPRHPSGLHLR